MTESSGELAAVEQLLAEGDAVRGWLARLEQAPVSGSSTVRDRVRSDYQQRLDQITAGLGAHADVISAKLATDRQEHDELFARATTARDALAEAELRHAVGEYDGDRFAGEQRRYTSDIESFDLALGAAAERIARLEQVHALVQRPPQPFLIDVEPDLVEDAIVADPDSVTISELAPDAEEALAVFDETGSTDEQSAAPVSSDNGPLSFRPSGMSAEPPSRPTAVVPPRPRTFESAAPLGIPSADTPPRFVRPGERLAGPPAPPVVMPAVETRNATPPESAPAAEPVGEPVGRTLRCGECGAMNRPLEWYCEKCGAELTAV